MKENVSKATPEDFAARVEAPEGWPHERACFTPNEMMTIAARAR